MQKVLHILLTITLSTSILFAQQWAQFSAQPGSTDRSDDIFFIDTQTGWAIKRGASGAYIYKTIDGGNSWITQFSQPSGNTHFRALGFFNANRGFVGNLGAGSFSSATDTNPLYETSDGGTTWTAVTGLPANVIGICAIYIVDANTIYAGGRVRGPGDGNAASNFTNLLKSTDQGTTWSVINVNDATLGAGNGLNGIMDVYFSDANNGFIIGMEDVTYTSGGGSYRGRILRTNDGGATWTTIVTAPTTGTYFWKVVFPSANIGYASLQQNNAYSSVVYYKTTNGGATWIANSIPLASMSPVPGSFFVQGIGCVDDNSCWIGGSGNSSTTSINLLETTNGGTTWTNATYNDTRRMNKFRFLSPTFGVASGARLHVYRVPIGEVGDDPCDAAVVSVSGITFASSITNTLTQATSVPAPDFFSNTGSTTAAIWNTSNVCEDRWFKIEVPPSGGFRMEVNSTAGSADLAMAAYNGSCASGAPASFILIGADDGTIEPELSISCQTPGDTVFIRMWEFGCNATSDFTLTVTDIVNEPIGDEPETAVCLDVNLPSEPESPFLPIPFNSDYFETKNNNNFPSCTTDFDIGEGCEDIWFKFTVPVNETVHIEVDNTNTVYWTEITLYDGFCGNELTCSTGNTTQPRIDYVANAGDELYFRVFDYGCNMEDQDGSRLLNVRAFITNTVTPTNCTGTGTGDDPCDAPCIAIGGSGLVNIDNTLTQTGMGIPDPTDFSNTGSTQVWNTANTCEDRWVRAVVPASGGFHIGFSGSDNLAVAVYTGDCSSMSPTGFSQIGADDGSNVPDISVACLIPGEEVYIRVWDFNCDGTGSSTLTLSDLNTLPIGDEPSMAINIGTNSAPFPATLGGTYTETKSPSFPIGCQNGASDGNYEYPNGCEDIWFEVHPPQGEIVRYKIDNVSGGSTDLNMAIYEGGCPSGLSLIACDVNGGTGNNPEILEYSETTPTVYIRVWDDNCDFSTDIGFTIQVCTEDIPFDLPLCSTTEVPLETSFEVNVSQGTQTNAATTFPSIPPPIGCTNMASDSWTAEAQVDREDSWVQFIVPPSGAVQITGESTVPAGNAELAVYATDHSNPCLPITLLACDGDSGGNGVSQITLNCLTPGDVLYIRAWDEGTNNSFLFDLFITELPSSPTTASVNLSGYTVVCQNDAAPTISFNFSGGTAPYSAIYSINGGANQSITTSTSSASVPQSTNIVGTYNYIISEVSDAIGCTSSTETFIIEVVSPCSLVVSPKVLLQGPLNTGTLLMNDDLRSAGLLPTSDPYGSGVTILPSILTVIGNDAIVDWVQVEIRDAATNTLVLATTAALLQRDGDVVALDGISPVEIAYSNSGNYHIAVRHRNHLAVMANQTVFLLPAQ